MKTTLIRIVATSEFPKATYVKTVSKDGGFTITGRKGKARRFTSDRAREVMARMEAGFTAMTFDTCEVQP